MKPQSQNSNRLKRITNAYTWSDTLTQLINSKHINWLLYCLLLLKRRAVQSSVCGHINGEAKGRKTCCTKKRTSHRDNGILERIVKNILLKMRGRFSSTSSRSVKYKNRHKLLLSTFLNRLLINKLTIYIIIV